MAEQLQLPTAAQCSSTDAISPPALLTREVQYTRWPQVKPTLLRLSCRCGRTSTSTPRMCTSWGGRWGVGSACPTVTLWAIQRALLARLCICLETVSSSVRETLSLEGKLEPKVCFVSFVCMHFIVQVHTGSCAFRQAGGAVSHMLCPLPGCDQLTHDCTDVHVRDCNVSSMLCLLPGCDHPTALHGSCPVSASTTTPLITPFNVIDALLVYTQLQDPRHIHALTGFLVTSLGNSAAVADTREQADSAGLMLSHYPEWQSKLPRLSNRSHCLLVDHKCQSPAKHSIPPGLPRLWSSTQPLPPPRTPRLPPQPPPKLGQAPLPSQSSVSSQSPCMHTLQVEPGTCRMHVSSCHWAIPSSATQPSKEALWPFSTLPSTVGATSCQSPLLSAPTAS